MFKPFISFQHNRVSFFVILYTIRIYCSVVPKPGGNIFPPIIWLYPPSNLSMIFICIPSNKLTLVCTRAQVYAWYGEKSVPFLVKTFLFFFFWSSPEFGEKYVPFLVKTFFFGLHLICSPKKSLGRGSFSPMLKIGQNWGKIANYPLQCSKICTTDIAKFLFLVSDLQATDGLCIVIHYEEFYSCLEPIYCFSYIFYLWKIIFAWQDSKFR